MKARKVGISQILIYLSLFVNLSYDDSLKFDFLKFEVYQRVISLKQDVFK